MTAIIVKNVRLSFPTLWTPEKFENTGTARYSASFLIPKDDTEQIDMVEAAVDEAGSAKWGTKWSTVKKSRDLKMFGWRDGDDKSYDGYQDHMYISANQAESRGKVVVKDQLLRDLSETDGIPYAGCYVNGKVEFYADDRYGKAINCALIAVQFVRDGEAFSGGSRYQEGDFEVLDVPGLETLEDVDAI